MKKEFGDRISKLRIEKGASQSEVAEYIGMTTGAYQKYEYGIREAGYETIAKLAEYYNVTTDYLLGREAAPDPFGDLNLCEEDEAEVLKKYMSLPDSIRACMLDVLVQLGDAAKNRDVSPERVAGCQRQPQLLEARLKDN